MCAHNFSVHLLSLGERYFFGERDWLHLIPLGELWPCCLEWGSSQVFLCLFYEWFVMDAIWGLGPEETALHHKTHWPRFHDTLWQHIWTFKLSVISGPFNIVSCIEKLLYLRFSLILWYFEAHYCLLDGFSF